MPNQAATANANMLAGSAHAPATGAAAPDAPAPAAHKADFASYISAQRASLSLGTGFGLALGFILHASLSGFDVPHMIVLGVAIALIAFGALQMANEMIPNGQPAAEAMPAEREGTDAPVEDFAPLVTWEDNVRSIADEHGLSQREYEVLTYLARGRNAAYIQQELWVSIHTVKTHMANIYRKLDVHSIQEIIDMVEQAENLHMGKQEGAPHGETREEEPQTAA